MRLSQIAVIQPQIASRDGGFAPFPRSSLSFLKRLDYGHSAPPQYRSSFSSLTLLHSGLLRRPSITESSEVEGGGFPRAPSELPPFPKNGGGTTGSPGTALRASPSFVFLAISSVRLAERGSSTPPDPLVRTRLRGFVPHPLRSSGPVKLGMWDGARSSARSYGASFLSSSAPSFGTSVSFVSVHQMLVVVSFLDNSHHLVPVDERDGCGAAARNPGLRPAPASPASFRRIGPSFNGSGGEAIWEKKIAVK